MISMSEGDVGDCDGVEVDQVRVEVEVAEAEEGLWREEEGGGVG